MTKGPIFAILHPILAIGITVALVGVAHAAAYDVDPEDRWAWSSDAGWINFDPPNGGVVVYDDHLEGYAWGENVGWVHFGSTGPVAYRVRLLIYRVLLPLVTKGS